MPDEDEYIEFLITKYDANTVSHFMFTCVLFIRSDLSPSKKYSFESTGNAPLVECFQQ